MARFSQRVQELNLPLDEVVVIGSGLLDALGFRVASDVDVAVSDHAYAVAKASGRYNERTPYPEETVLEADGVEIWRGWTTALPYEVLRQQAMVIDGICYIHPRLLLQQKQRSNRPKDQADIAFLKDYLRQHDLSS